MLLQDKVAIVTGAASGIGKEIAAIFANEGAKVAIADLDQSRRMNAARSIDPGGRRVWAWLWTSATNNRSTPLLGKSFKRLAGWISLLAMRVFRLSPPR